MARFSIVLLFCSISFFSAFPQLTVVRIPKGQTRKAVHRYTPSSARIQDTVIALTLPFWDDFSVSSSPYYPNNKLWQDGESVSLNDGISRNPPSLGAVSFDGLDSLGKPYDQTNALTKGYGDKLVSMPIRLDNVPLAQRDSVYISFFFQWQGYGEPPDPGDQLELDFKINNQTDTTQDSTLWATVLTISRDTTMNDSTFYSRIVQITDPYFYNQFQFRFRSYGRISGPWDNWNLDYVYVNTHRFNTDLSFPDRTIYSPLTSLFKDYWSIPIKHFFADTTNTSLLIPPSFAVTNLRLDQGQFNGQPVNYTSTATMVGWKAGAVSSTKTLKLDSAHSINPDLEANQLRTVFLNTIPAVSDFDGSADSIRVTLQTGINSGDNRLDRVPPRDSGDYTPNYIPIDFRVNDTTRATYTLSNYYAYDDGTAEFGAGLNQPAAEVAYLFKMITPNPDTIVAVDMYFPDFGDESTQTIRLTIRKDTSIRGVIYQDTVFLQRSELNKFWRYKLKNNLTGVKDSFLLGWTQTSSAVIALGLDRSNDTGDRIFYNVDGFWVQNLPANPDYVAGSLMIRPVFGKGGVVTGLPPEPVVLDVFPNPNTGSFYLSRKPDQLVVLDFTGRPIPFSQETVGDRTKIDLSNPIQGIYIVKAFVAGKMITRKVMVHL